MQSVYWPNVLNVEIVAYPSTVLVGPDGTVLGTFYARDAKDATEQLERLLKREKK